MVNDQLPVPGFDQLSVGDLGHRIRSLDEERLRTLLEHEREHANRTPVVELLRTRLEQVAEGAPLSTGDPDNTPPVPGTPGGSTVDPATADEPGTPLRHGVAEQTPSRGRS